MKTMSSNRLKYLAVALLYGVLFVACKSADTNDKLYTYTLSADATADAYDEAVKVACLQGIMNRDKTQIYLLSDAYERPAYWLDTLAASGAWLEKKESVAIATLGELVEWAGDREIGRASCRERVCQDV